MKEPTLAGTRLDRYFHICGFFNSRDEEYEVLSPFYKEAIAWGEKTMHIVNPVLREDHLRRLDAKGIDTVKCLACGQLEVVNWDLAYLDEHGAFSSERMLGAVDAVFNAGKQAGFPRMRIMGNMNWALTGRVTGADELIEYEARVNDVLSRQRQPAVCVYDIAKLTGTMMMDILRCHPLTLVGGVVQENPFYVPPDELLPTLRERQGRQPAAALN